MAWSEPERLWTVQQVAEYLGVSPETVRRWLRDERAGVTERPTLHGVQFSKRAGWRVRDGVLQAFIERRDDGGPP
jgi:hypothetical protein